MKDDFQISYSLIHNTGKDDHVHVFSLLTAQSIMYVESNIEKRPPLLKMFSEWEVDGYPDNII